MEIGLKSDRYSAIINLIKENVIATQEELARALNRAGFHVTQATVSRDIRKLNLMKASVNGVIRYILPLQDTESVDIEKFTRIIKEGFISMDMAQNILVIKTVSGMAMAVCAAIDGLKMNEIVGTIAGDDTIMCAVRSVEDTKKVMIKIKNML